MSLMELPIDAADSSGVSIDEITDLSKRLGICIPARYREFLERQNGGFLDEAYIFGGNEVGNLIPMSWLGIDSSDTIEEYFVAYSGIIGEEFVPFCSDPGGNFFCLFVKNCIDMGVFFIDIGNGWQREGLIQYPKIKVAEDIDDFAKLIKFGLP